MKEYTIAESLQPTFENVTREFITDTMYKILFDNELPNFKFEFREEEAVKYIEKVLQKNSYQYNYKREKLKKVLQSIKQKSNGNQIMPVMIVKDYKTFFELLRQVYEKDIELFFKRTGFSGFRVYEMRNCFEQIWLRATPEDFNKPEEFLRKQVEMIKNTTFSKFNNPTYLGKIKFFNNKNLAIKNADARTWDEAFKEMKVMIYDNQNGYNLPVIRYGIYEKDGKKICQIGSIQNENPDEEKDKDIERKKYKINKGISDEEILKVEPKNVFALFIFINLLHQEGITEIEVPSLYVLDYEYHEKRSEQLKRQFEEEWPSNVKMDDLEEYQIALRYLKRNYKKQDLISEIKSERFIRIFDRILYHYPQGIIKGYPGELDSFLHLNIPIIKDKSEIRGEPLQEIYDVMKQKSFEEER